MACTSCLQQGNSRLLHITCSVAMRLPWWTLNTEFTAIQEMAQLKGKSPEEVRYSNTKGTFVMPVKHTRYLLSEEAAAAAQVQTQGAAKEVKTPQQCLMVSRGPDKKLPAVAPQACQKSLTLCKQLIALTRADALLDYVAAGALASYDAVRPDLAAAYKEAGLTDMANFIIAAS
eukprot:1161003-Pelagomonas_calceolata.AAC.5